MEATFNRRGRDNNGRSLNYNFNLCGGGSNYRWFSDSGCQDDAQYRSRQNYQHNINRILKDQRGGAIDFIIISTLVLFMIFAGIDYFVALSQHQIAQHITMYYLERVRIEGRLTSADEAEMRNRFTAARMTVTEITGPRQSAGNPAVTRNPEDANACKITMTVTLKPAERPFIIGRLIGGNAAGDSWRIKTGGTVLSEKI